MTDEEFLHLAVDLGRRPTLDDLMERFKAIHKLEEVKSGSGDKQTSLFYLREKTDPKGDYFQATALTYDGIIWERDRAIRSNAQWVLNRNPETEVDKPTNIEQK